MQTLLIESGPNNQTAHAQAIVETASASVTKQIASCKTERSLTASGRDGDDKSSRMLIEALTHSKIYQEYEHAFSDTTGLPLSLLPVETEQLPHHGKRMENPFCALLAHNSRACSACLLVLEQLCEKAALEAQTVVCQAAMRVSAVPVRLGERLIGFLHTGQIFRTTPTTEQFERLTKLMADWDVEVKSEMLRRAYFSTKVIPPKKHEAVVKLLAIFAQHLARLGNQILAQQENSEPLIVKRAKEYIIEHQGKKLSLGQVARAVNTSRFYFCRIFKGSTGINYTDYLSRVRIEKAKSLLLNPSLRVSEVAFEVGFQSLTHFNREFKKKLGQSPTQYRTQLAVH